MRFVRYAAVVACIAGAVDDSARIAELEREFDALRARFEADAAMARAAPKGEQEAAMERLVATFTAARAKVADELITIAEAAPKEPAALRAVGIALGGTLEGRRLDAALAVLGEHAEEAAIGAHVPKLSGHPGKGVDALLGRVLARNPERGVRGAACFQLAMRTRDEAARAKLLERLVAEFADVPHDGETLGEIAQRRLFALRELRPGRPAPEISGKDMDGAAMTLGDFRGKVVLLEFWGYW
jgi:hypothetical protein